MINFSELNLRNKLLLTFLFQINFFITLFIGFDNYAMFSVLSNTQFITQNELIRYAFALLCTYVIGYFLLKKLVEKETPFKGLLYSLIISCAAATVNFGVVEYTVNSLPSSFMLHFTYFNILLACLYYARKRFFNFFVLGSAGKIKVNNNAWLVQTLVAALTFYIYSTYFFDSKHTFHTFYFAKYYYMMCIPVLLLVKMTNLINDIDDEKYFIDTKVSLMFAFISIILIGLFYTLVQHVKF